jgi:PAS domain-containing protein
VLEALAAVRPMSWWRSALVGVGCAGVVLAFRWAASGLYPQVAGFTILLPGVLVAALAAGRTAGISATFAALLGGWWVAGPDAVGVSLDTPMGRIAASNFILVGLFCAIVADSLRKTLARLHDSLRDLSTAGAGARAAEQALRESEARFRLMADTAPSPVWMTNPDAEVEFVNAALVDFYGKPAEQILGHVWRQAIHPEDEGLVAEAMAK